MLSGSTGDSPSFDGDGNSSNGALPHMDIVGSVFLLFIFRFVFFSMVAYGGGECTIILRLGGKRKITLFLFFNLNII